MEQAIEQRHVPLEQSAFADFTTYLRNTPDAMGAIRDRLERSPRMALHSLVELPPDQERNVLAASDAGLALAVAPLINTLGVTLALDISNGFVRGGADEQSRSSARAIGWAIVHGGRIHYIDPWLAMDMIVLLATRGINPTNDALDELYHTITRG